MASSSSFPALRVLVYTSAGRSQLAAQSWSYKDAWARMIRRWLAIVTLLVTNVDPLAAISVQIRGEISSSEHLREVIQSVDTTSSLHLSNLLCISAESRGVSFDDVTRCEGADLRLLVARAPSPLMR